jgi:hypothetical protein
MRTLKNKGKGGGLLNRIVNFFSGRKKIRERHMRSVKLSNAEKEEKQRVQKKWFKSKSEKNKLRRFTAKLMPTNEESYSAYQADLAGRSKFQKYFNKYYKENNDFAKAKYVPIALGIYQHPRNIRKPFNRSAAKQPNNAITIPPIDKTLLSRGFVMKDGKKMMGPDGQPLLLIKETQHEAIMRTMPVLFDIWLRKKHRRQSSVVFFEDIPEDEWNEMSRDAQNLENQPLEQQAQQLFGKSLKFINDLIQIEEEGHISGDKNGPKNTKVVQARIVLDDGSYAKNPDGSYKTEPKIGVGGGISLGRYLPPMRLSKLGLLKSSQLNDRDRCGAPIEEDKPASRRDRIQFKPLVSLKSNGCLAVINTVKNFYRYAIETGEASDLFYKNWIILAKDFMEPVYPFTTIFAKRFLHNLVIQDAIENWGIIGMDPLFYELLRVKYPEILMKNSSYIVSTKEFPYKKEKILKDHDNFLLLDSEFYSGEMEITVANPFREEEDNHLNEIFTSAAKKGAWLGMTPYMAFTCQKLNPTLWKQFVTEGQRNNSIDNNSNIYATLNAKEKIVVDYLQFMRYMNILEDDPEPYNFRKAKLSYKDPLGEPGIVSTILQIFNEDGAKHRRELNFYQRLVENQLREGENPSNLESQADIEQLLRKFKLNLRIRIPPVGNINFGNQNRRPARTVRRSFPAQRSAAASVPLSLLRTARRSGPVSVSAPASEVNQALRSADMARQQSREEILRKIQTIDAAYRKAQAVYNNVTRRRGTRSGNIRYLSRRAALINQAELVKPMTQNERQIISNLSVLRRFPTLQARAVQEIAQLRDQLAALNV